MNNVLRAGIIFLTTVTLLVSACAHKQHIKDLPGVNRADSFDIPKIRLSAVEQTAATVGAQGALAWASRGINAALERDDQRLAQVFNFRALLLNNNVLPPVLSEGSDALATDDPNSLRLADRVYKIESSPRFVTAAPTWREYLWMNYPPPERPNTTLLPRNKEEQRAWERYYDQGWKDGAVQANQIFSENMGRLKRDYNGMILYNKLLAQKMVTPPYVAKSELGVTGDANQIRINDQILRITATSQLVTDSKQWKTVVVPGQVGGVRKQGSAGTETLQ